ncbi:MAG: hypothetical protein H0W16_00415 [Actinobacteria bacterium]|nr:hypothetical protein [Actinomycetota bacterium]
MAWGHGQVIVHRELWRGRPWFAMPAYVVEDNPDLLVTYLLPEEAPFASHRVPTDDRIPGPEGAAGKTTGCSRCDDRVRRTP